jgi:nitrite reductase/ring-hydroxylating ferredoxin subunit
MPAKSAKPTPDADGFYLAGPAADLAEDQLLALKIAGDSVLVTRLDGQLFAFSAVCPHAAADLGKGAFYRGRIDCPDHGYRFDVRTGRVLWPPDEVCRLKRYQVLEDDGWIKVKPAPGRR